MVEVTRVPLQPIKKGSLARLWLGIAAVILAGAALAWFTVPKGVSVTTITAGLGASPTAQDVVFIKYKGTLEDGKEFDAQSAFPVPLPPGMMPDGYPMLLENSIPGFAEGIVRMQKGGKYKLYIPSEKAYGQQGMTNPQTGEVEIPPNADLVFEIELVDFMTRADAERRMQMVQQMMQMQQQQQAPGGAAPGDAPPTAGPPAQ